MSARPLSRPHVALIAATLVVLLIASQGAAAASLPKDGRASTGRVLGKAGFAYFTGLRTFAAAVMWNRIDPIYHDYYGEGELSTLAFALPSMRLVTILDPQFEQAYYVASFVVAKRGMVEEGVSIAREGVENNPRSGLMRTNLINVLTLQDKDKNLSEMLEQTRIGLGDDIHWVSDNELYEGLVAFRTVYHVAGDNASADRIDARMKWLKENGDIGQDHDHDGDGVQDH